MISTYTEYLVAQLYKVALDSTYHIHMYHFYCLFNAYQSGWLVYYYADTKLDIFKPQMSRFRVTVYKLN